MTTTLGFRLTILAVARHNNFVSGAHFPRFLRLSTARDEKIGALWAGAESRVKMASPRGFVGYITRITLPCEAWLKVA